MTLAEARRDAGALVGLTGAPAVVLKRGRVYDSASRDWYEDHGVEDGWSIVEEIDDDPRSVFLRKKGEGVVQYHDRLVGMGKEMSLAGSHRTANQAFAIAGTIARHNEIVREQRRAKQSGPGTYPFSACLQDAMSRYGNKEQAGKVCGFIRNTSKMTYPAYWEARGKTP